MCVDSLYHVSTNRSYRALFATPYENQVRLIFSRLRELIDFSPLVKKEVVRSTSNPFLIEFANGSSIVGFTTGAASGSGGASIRGQRADGIYMDEVDKIITFDMTVIYNHVKCILDEKSRRKNNLLYDKK